jgi:putative ABC transport system ATP-binding protein
MGSRSVEVEGVTFRYGKGELAKTVLQGVSLSIDAGEVVLLTGPSGSGKTTLLTLIGALRAVQEGSVRVLGTDLSKAKESERVALRSRIGFIFQLHNLLEFLTARQNVAMALELDPTLGEGERLKRADAALAAVGLGEFGDRLPANLSGGQRQRVAIARAMVHDPGLILADEPTAALDGKTGSETMHLLRDLAKQQGRTILLVTHDPRILDIADRIVAMEDGRIVEASRGTSAGPRTTLPSLPGAGAGSPLPQGEGQGEGAWRREPASAPK